MTNNKFSGLKKDFIAVREDGGRIIVSYGLTKVNKTIFEWYEVHFYKKQFAQVSFADVKAAILADIDLRTKDSIIGSFVWNEKPVWLSVENQLNFAAYEHRAAVTGDNLPLTTKIGELEDGTPINHTFETAEELTAFWNACQDHIEVCRQAGRTEKESIDWQPYKDWFGIVDAEQEEAESEQESE